MTNYWIMNTFQSLIVTFVSLLVCIVPVMIIAYWPEDYNIIWKTRRKLINLGRNDLCICGSGKKYKRCCIEKFNNAYRVERWWLPKKK